MVLVPTTSSNSTIIGLSFAPVNSYNHRSSYHSHCCSMVTFRTITLVLSTCSRLSVTLLLLSFRTVRPSHHAVEAST